MMQHKLHLPHRPLFSMIGLLLASFISLTIASSLPTPAIAAQTCCCSTSDPNSCETVELNGQTCQQVVGSIEGGSWVEGNRCQSAASTTASADPCKSYESEYDIGEHRSFQILPGCTKCGDCSLADFLQLFINLYTFGLHYILAPLAMLFIVIGSILLLTASGYSERIEKGRTMIAQTIAGIIIVLISWIVIDTTIYLLTGNHDRTILSKKWYGGDELTYPCYISKTVSLQSNCSGVDVKTLQSNLTRLGYKVKVNSVYGAQTSTAVKNFQNDVNSGLMVIDGRGSCSVPLWDQIFHTDWNKTGQLFFGDSTCEVALGSNNGSTADVYCVADGIFVRGNTLPTNGIDDYKTNNLISLFAGSFAGEYQTHCKKST